MKPYSPNVTWKRSVITKRLDERSYQVDTDSGTYHHNQSHLRKTNESDPLNDAYSSTTNAKVKHYVADQPAMSDYSTATPVSEDVYNDTPTPTKENTTSAPMPKPTRVSQRSTKGNSTSKIKPMNNIQVFIHITTDLIILIYIYRTLFGNFKNNGKRRML